MERVEAITVSNGQIRVALKQQKGRQRSIEIPWTPKPKGTALPIQGLVPGRPYHLSPCCQPLIGDRIIGVITQNEGIMVHTADCDRLEDVQDQPERWLDLKWSPEAVSEVQVGRLKITLNNEAGTLANMCSVIARHNGNITNLKIDRRTPLVFDMFVDIEVRDAKHLASIVSALRASPTVHAVDRPHGEKELIAHDA